MFDLGQKVACVDDSFPAGVNDIFNALPRKGRVYTVRDIVPGQTWDLKGTCAVMLVELENLPNRHGIEPGFAVHRFRELTPDELAAIEAVTADLEAQGMTEIQLYLP